MNLKKQIAAVGLLLLAATFAHSQQLKPTEIIYSRMPTNVLAPPVGANQPTIWAVGQDGSNDRFITNGTMPRISDDGRFLVFKSFTRHPSFYDPHGAYTDFVVRDLATGLETIILSFGFNNNNSGFSLSPESNQGSFEILLDRDCFMFKMNRDGSGPSMFPWENANYCYDDFPVSRRGGDQLIAFTSNVVTPELGGVYTMEIGGANRQKIPNTTCRDFHAAWSNDNQYIAFGTIFLTCNNNFPSVSYPYWISNLVKIKPDGTGRQQLTNFPSSADCTQTSSNCFTLGYVWTENNSKVIAAGRINGAKGLFAVNTDGSGSVSQIPISPGNAPEFVGGIVQSRVDRNVVSIGGGPATGGNYTLVSTIGEAIAGITSTGGSYSFESGFWPAVVASVSRKAPFDFDGDGKTDVGIFRPSVGEWWIYRSSTGSTFAAQFGASTDQIAAADFTGDGRSDIAFWRPATGEWFVLRSEDNSFFSFPFGAGGDVPVPADYDADGKADPAVFRPSSGLWFIQRSSDNGTTISQFGANGDRPIPADYDGDGKADLAIYRVSAGEWWLNRTAAGSIVYQFGNSSDKQVQGDYTGDGKADVAFWRPSTGEWFILRSEDSSYYSAPFGSASDLATPGDYDGDGKFDTAVFRPSSSLWFVERTSAGTLIQQFGSSGDRPLPNAFVR